MLVESDIPIGSDGNPVRFGVANTMGKADLDIWMDFLHRHQEGLIPFKRGLIFKPTALAAAADAFTGTLIAFAHWYILTINRRVVG